MYLNYKEYQLHTHLNHYKMHFTVETMHIYLIIVYLCFFLARLNCAYIKFFTVFAMVQ